MSDLETTILKIVEKWWADLRTERHGMVTSYDPKSYLAKVTFLPEGQESGWLPIETGHIGNGYGIAIGLNPGDGKTSGDQVVVRYQEGDLESGKIVQRVHSDMDRPPQVQAGEAVIWTRFKKSASGQANLGDDPQAGGSEQDPDSAKGGTGQQIYFKNDGTITLTDGNGTTINWDGQGTLTVTTSVDTIVNTTRNTVVNAQGKVEVTSPTVNIAANTHLGSDGGVPASQQGTIDTGGYSDIGALATKVWTT